MRLTQSGGQRTSFAFVFFQSSAFLFISFMTFTIRETENKQKGEQHADQTIYLVTNDTASSFGKNKKANELGIPIIFEEDFIQKFGR